MWPPLQDEGTGVIRKKTIVSLKETTKEQEDVSWKTVIVQYEDQTFFGRLTRKSSFFNLDVVMKANKEDCEKYLIEASMVDAKTDKIIFKAIFPPRPLVKENNPGYCLLVPQEAMARVWKLTENGKGYYFSQHIKITRNITI